MNFKIFYKKGVTDLDYCVLKFISTRLSRIYTLELFIMIISAYPLLKILGTMGIITWLFLTVITIVTAFRLERVKKEYDIQTYKEIVSFYENRTLSHDEKIEENAKISYQRFLLSLLSAVIAFIVFIVLKILFD